MPANIAARPEGGYAAAYVNRPAWHNLGTVVDAAMTPEEAIATAGTGFTVAKAPLFAIVNDEAVEVESHAATYRTDTGDVLGIVSTGYQIIQNVTPMQLLIEIVRTKQAGIVAHAALGKGERLFAVLELSRLTDLQVDGDPSKIEAFLVAQWWHDGTGALSFGPSTVRVDCQNMANAQLAHAENRGLLVRIPHVGNVTDAVDEARRILGFAERRLIDFTALMNQFADLRLPSDESAWLDSFLTRLVPIPPEMERPVVRQAAREAIAGLYWTSPNLDRVTHSPYRAIQAVNEYADHYRPLRVGDAELVPARRFTSSVDGPAARLKADAVRLVREEFEVRA